MTKSTITRERLLAIADDNSWVKCTHDEVQALARIALAALDSESECLPLDYLQGHKDGLEWAAKLAEANHPETGDWLYDDPIELAKAIRKGPDMPPVQPVADSETDRNPVLAYADSYRDMAKQGVESVPIWIVITDLERNIAPRYRHAQPESGLELAGWQFKSVNGDWLGIIDEHGKNQAVREGCEVREVFAMADGVNERDQVRREHAEWSQATFGNVGPVGPLKHLCKEALEAAAEPGDLSEWADMQFLLWDAQRRAGITDEQITQAMIDKLAVNKQRSWPEPKDGEPRLHIEEQPAPVVPEEIDSIISKAVNGVMSTYSDSAEECRFMVRNHISQACRAAMLQNVTLANEGDIQAGNSLEIPEGYVLVPREPTDEMIAAAMDCDDVLFNSDETFCVQFGNIYEAMTAAAPQEVTSARVHPARE